MRQVIGLSVVLALSLVGSYLSWTSDEEVIDDDAVVVVQHTAKELTSLEWDSEDSTTVISRRSDDLGDYLWIESTVRTKKRKAPELDRSTPGEGEGTEGEGADGEASEGEGAEDAGGEAPEAAEPEGAEPEGAEPEGAEPEGEGEAPGEPEVEIETKVSNFKGSAQADEMWDDFAPLEALRELEATGEIDPATFGFDEPEATITITTQKGEQTLVVGGQTYGSKDRYVQHGDRVYLIDDTTLRPLQFATSRLVERSLFPSSAKETSRIEVSFGDGTSESFEQKNADDPAKAFWARASDPETADETAGTWIDKLFRLRLREYVADDEVEGDLVRVFGYTAHGGDGAYEVELFRVDQEGEDKPLWYARSTFTRSLVTLTDSLARNVVDDLDSLRASP